MRAVSIVHAVGDDWKGLYVNGCLWTEGHHVSLNDLAEAIASLGGVSFTFAAREVDYDWLENHGGFPKDMESVIWS